VKHKFKHPRGLMVKKTKLSVKYTPDFKVIALFSQQKDYRICWLINHHLQFDMKRLSDFCFTPYKQSETIQFPVYGYADRVKRLHYFLLTNKRPEGILFELPKNMDYLLLIKNPGAGFEMKTCVNNLRNIDNIQGAFPLENGLGNRSDLILYDFEIYADEAIRSSTSG